MAKPHLYFVITKKCNLRCKHCYLDAGPERSDTTIKEEDFKKVINNLPKFSLDLLISGGEVFTIKETLYDYLNYIKEENSKRKIQNQGKINVELQTNASWAVNDEKSESILSELLALDVKKLDISSKDYYHYKQGIKPKNLKRLREILESSKPFSFTFRGTQRQYVMPLGRAEKMNLRKPVFNYDLCKDSFDTYFLDIGPDGTVYNCCFGFFQLPGNLIEDTLVEIVKKAKKDERLNAIDSGGIGGLAIYDGWKKRDVEDLISVYGKCGFCYQLYKQGLNKK